MATASTVGHTTFTTPSHREIALTRILDAPRKLVWAALTSPRHVPHWMYGPDGWTMPVCEIDLRPGGKWHFVWRGSDGKELDMRGVYREVRPPDRLANTEAWGGNWPETFNTTIFSEMGSQTKIVSTVLWPSTEARDAALATGMKEGWSQSFDRLDDYLRTLD